MNLALTVLEIVAPVFLLAAIGFTWVKLGAEYRIRFVTQLSMTLGVPCLIFTALMKTELEPTALTALTLASVAAYAAVSVVTALVVRLLRLETRTFTAPLPFPSVMLPPAERLTSPADVASTRPNTRSASPLTVMRIFPPAV